MNEYTLEDLVMELLRKENDETPMTNTSITARGGYCIPAVGPYDISEEEVEAAKRLDANLLEHSAPHAERGGVEFMCGTAATALARMEEEDARA